jgi:hypothetical protein
MLLIKACLLGFSLFRRVSYPCIHLVCVTGCSSSPILLCICWTWSLLTVGCRTMATCVRWAAMVPSLEAWSLRSLLSKRGPRPPVFFLVVRVVWFAVSVRGIGLDLRDPWTPAPDHLAAFCSHLDRPQASVLASRPTATWPLNLGELCTFQPCIRIEDGGIVPF